MILVVRKHIQPSTLSQSQTALGMLREQTWSKADPPQKRWNNHARKDGIKYIKRDSIKVVQKGGMKLVKRGAISLNMVRDSLSIVFDDKAQMPPNEQIQVPMTQSKHIIPIQMESDEIVTTDEALIKVNDVEEVEAQKAAAKKDFEEKYVANNKNEVVFIFRPSVELNKKKQKQGYITLVINSNFVRYEFG